MLQTWYCAHMSATTTHRVTAPDADAAVELARENHLGRITGTSTRRSAPGEYVVTVTDYGSAGAPR